MIPDSDHFLSLLSVELLLATAAQRQQTLLVHTKALWQGFVWYGKACKHHLGNLSLQELPVMFSHWLPKCQWNPWPLQTGESLPVPQCLSILSQAAFPLTVLLFRGSEPKPTVPATLFCSWEFKIFVSGTGCSFVKPVLEHRDCGNRQSPFEWMQCFALNFAIKHWGYGCGVYKVKKK